MRIPQLRILSASFCGRKCIYCRPTGEGGGSCASEKFIDMNNALTVCGLYREMGGEDVKITGGDPVFWPHLVPFVRCLKEELGFKRVEVITRSPQILERLEDLVTAGMDILNFSLDTVDKSVYEKITGCYDFDNLIAAIRDSAQVVPVKMNAVIMKDINDLNVKELISFCESVGVQQLKLLDVIKDLQIMDRGNCERLHEFGVEKLDELYVSLASVCADIKKTAVEVRTVSQGGLGHPMDEFKMESGLIVTVKNSENGAWYGNGCKDCPFYPCHDALMAIRLTPDNRLQHCLLNEKRCVSLNGLSQDGIAEAFSASMELYDHAEFIK